MRVAVGIHGHDVDKIIESYNLVSLAYTRQAFTFVSDKDIALPLLDVREVLHPCFSHHVCCRYSYATDVFVLLGHHEGRLY